MGEVTVAAFAVLALLGLGLVGLGVFRKSRVLTVLGRMIGVSDEDKQQAMGRRITFARQVS